MTPRLVVREVNEDGFPPATFLQVDESTITGDAIYALETRKNSSGTWKRVVINGSPVVFFHTGRLHTQGIPNVQGQQWRLKAL